MTSSSRWSIQWKLWSTAEFVVQILADIGAQSALSSLYDLHGIFKLYIWPKKELTGSASFLTIEIADGFESNYRNDDLARQARDVFFFLVC